MTFKMKIYRVNFRKTLRDAVVLGPRPDFDLMSRSRFVRQKQKAFPSIFLNLRRVTANKKKTKKEPTKPLRYNNNLKEHERMGSGDFWSAGFIVDHQATANAKIDCDLLVTKTRTC